jgi:hypothetical protein
MNLDEARAIIDELTRELVIERELAASAARKSAGLQTIIRGYVEMFPELAELAEVDLVLEPDTSDGVPRGSSAVRLVLHDSPGAWVLVSEVLNEVRRRGWVPDSDNPANAIRTALERLTATENSDVHKGKQDNNVVYGYFPDGPPKYSKNSTRPSDPVYGDEEPF